MTGSGNREIKDCLFLLLIPPHLSLCKSNIDVCSCIHLVLQERRRNVLSAQREPCSLAH